MKVSMDGLRCNLARSYSELVEYLRDYLPENNIDEDQLQDLLLSLRQDIAVLHCIHQPEDELFNDMVDEIDKNLLMPTFGTNEEQ